MACMHMQTFIHACMLEYICIHICMYNRRHAYIHAYSCIHAYLYKHMHAGQTKMHEWTHACIYVCRDFVFMVVFMRAWTHVHNTTHLHSQGSILSHPTPHPTGEGAGHHQVAHDHGVGVGGVGTQDMYIPIMYIHKCTYIDICICLLMCWCQPDHEL